MKRPTNRIWSRSPSLFWVALLALVLPANAGTLDELRKDRAELQAKLKNQQYAAQEKEHVLNQLSVQIQDLKNKQAKQRLILRGYRLQSLLSEAEEVSQNLQSLRQKEQRTRSRLEKNRSYLISSLDEAIDEQAKRVHETKALIPKKRAAKKLTRLSNEREALAIQTQTETLPNTMANLTQKVKDPEELADRLKAINDFQGRLRKEVALLRDEISHEKRQEFMRQEIGHLLEEEAFFGERGFIHGSTPRTKDEAATALAKTSTEEVTEESTETSSTPEDSSIDVVSPELPALPPEGNPMEPSEEMNGGDELQIPAEPLAPPMPEGEIPSLETANGSPEALSTVPVAPETEVVTQNRLEIPSLVDAGNEAALDVQNRDPLAQLASEFGLDADQLQDLELPQNAPTEHLHWLAQRLETTQAILLELEKLARKIQKQLTPTP